MPSVELLRPSQKYPDVAPVKRRGRLPALCLLLGLSIGYTVVLSRVAPAMGAPVHTFILLWLISFLPYLAACVLIFATRKPDARGQWRELALILGGSLVLHAILLPIPPNLSYDSWRYLWDARVTLHGFSPYVYTPNNPLLVPLRNILFYNSDYHRVPTVYPPGAQAVYLFSYLLAPSNLFVFKGLLIVCDLVTTGAIAFMLKRKGADPARCLLYAWCPLPIVEFAIQGHVDALTIMLMALALVSAQYPRRSMQILTGFLIAWATLTKFYPILLLIMVVRHRRDWPLVLSCALTIILSYVPYIILGHGHVLGFFAQYFSQQDARNAGSITMLLQWISQYIHLSNQAIYLLDALIVGGTALLIWRLRIKERLSMEAAMLLLIGCVLLVSPHILPWYTTALLPWVALQAGSPWTPQNGWRGRELAALMVLYMCCLTIVSYDMSILGGNWNRYYLLVYNGGLLGLGLAGCVAYRHWYKRRRASALTPIYPARENNRSFPRVTDR